MNRLSKLKGNAIFDAIFVNRKGLVGFSILLLFTLVAILGPRMSPYDPYQSFTPYQPPSLSHPLGTDYFGYDVLSWLIVGTRVSMLVGYLAGLGTTLLAVIMGVLGGYYDKTLFGELVNGITNIFLVLPGLPLLIILAAEFKFSSVYAVALGIIIISWSFSARVLRSQVLTLKSRDYVIADRTLGMSDFWILVKDVLPQMISIIFSTFLFSMIGAILTETTLDFIGLGDVNTVSWGAMLYWAEDELAYSNNIWWWFIPPGVAIGLVGAALVLINLALDEVTNTRLQAIKLMKKAESELERLIKR